MAQDSDGRRAEAEIARLRNLEDRLSHLQASLSSTTAQNERLAVALVDCRPRGQAQVAARDQSTLALRAAARSSGAIKPCPETCPRLGRYDPSLHEGTRPNPARPRVTRPPDRPS